MSAATSDGVTDDGWTTVNGLSGGKRNNRAKYGATVQHNGHTMRKSGQAINWKEKLSGIVSESNWFHSQSAMPRDLLVQHLVDLMEKHITEMMQTQYFRRAYQMVREAREKMVQSSTDSNPTSTSSPIHPFDTVIYGIGRYAEWTLISNPLPTATSTLTPSFARSGIRSSSRSPQLQLACIMAIARTMNEQFNAAQSTQPATSTPLPSTSSSDSSSTPSPLVAPSSSVSSTSTFSSHPPRIYMYDPMLSDLEKAIAAKLKIEIIQSNEEGKRQVDRPTLFYMPHCPQTLYNNVLWSNWGLNLSNIIIVGNSLQKYVDAYLTSLTVAAATSSSSHHNATSGYLRSNNHAAKKKKPTEFSLKLAAVGGPCCNHDHETVSTSTSADAASSTSSHNFSSSYPYPCLAAIGPILRESAIPNIHESQTVFNDVNLHYFHWTTDMRIALEQAGLRSQSLSLPSITVDSGTSAYTAASTESSISPLLASLLHRPTLPAPLDGNTGVLQVDTEIIRVEE